MSQLPELIQSLLQPEAYPEPPRTVELLQTQMSFVLLTGEYVYKVKKPVNLGYLDYTTLAKRKFYCQREVELNRRLCPDTYLGVVPLTRESTGAVCINGRGSLVEYAVKMRYLPQEAMMDVLLDDNRVSPEMVASVAEKLANFHETAEATAEISTFGDLATIKQNTEENFTQTEKYIGHTIAGETYDRIKKYTTDFIESNVPLFRKRIQDGRIRDCHGDLHAAHICFTDDICIYDCIEFNDRFRYCDVASEVAFLAMDLDMHRKPDLSRIFVSAYIKSSRDSELPELLSYYKCYRAYVRGKVASFQLDDQYITDDEKKTILSQARQYFELAVSYI